MYHPAKEKIRVIFDGSAEYNGVSLNKMLIQGPDLTNQLIGVFLRFWKEKVAFMADIEAMYYQVRVVESHRKYLCFVWWPEGNLESPLQDFEMCVHVFGAISSLGCGNYALRQTAADNKICHGSDASKTAIRNFYVDDMLNSKENDAEAIKLIKDTEAMCREGGFNLTKFVCTSPQVIESIPPEKCSEKVQLYNIQQSDKVEIPLGYSSSPWCTLVY